MSTKGHQFHSYLKPAPGVQAATASMAFQAPLSDHDPSQGSSLFSDASNRLAGAATSETVITPVDIPTGNLDLGLVDTTPGKRGSMSPPEGTDLTAAQYQDLMRKRYRDDPGHRQHMVLYAKRNAPCSGPYAEQARAILVAIRERKA